MEELKSYIQQEVMNLAFVKVQFHESLIKSKILDSISVVELMVAVEEKIGKKIRDTEVKRTPYMLVIGEKEVETNSVAVRKQGDGDKGTMTVDDFIAQLLGEIANYN